jgi:cyanate lyase
MNDSVIPADARQFLLNAIDSIAQLEGLLWLRAHAGESWDAVTLAGQLYISADEAAVLLEHLARRDLVVIETAADLRRYAYRPATAELDAVVTRIADLYRQYLIPVTHLIHAKPQDRLTSSIEAFADAFRLRKDKS